MLRGYVLHSRRSAASTQKKALEDAGVTVIYVEDKHCSVEDCIKSLRPGDGLAVNMLSDLAINRRELRKRVEQVHDRNAYVFEVATKRRSDKPKQLAEMIFEAADVLAQAKKGHDPIKAREFGSRGGRPRKDRGVTDADAEKHWFDMRHTTNDDALKHMGKWNENAAWRKWGASGRKTGPRRPLPAKPKRKT
jgi:hypothetical protein